jgi:hypothetical protein
MVNLLIPFMFCISLIGFLLVLLSLFIFNDLKPECPVDLKNKLRLALGLGTTSFILPISYLICINKRDCGEFSIVNMSLIVFMITMLILGILLVILISSIDNDMKICKLNNNFIVILYFISSFQIILPIVGIIIMYIKGIKPKPVYIEEPEEPEEPEGPYQSPADIERKAKAQQLATSTNRYQIVNAELAQQSALLAEVQLRLDQSRITKTKPKETDQALANELTSNIKDIKNNLTKIGDEMVSANGDRPSAAK